MGPVSWTRRGQLGTLGHGSLDLLLESDGSLLGRQRWEIGSKQVSGELLQERVVEVVGHDEALGRVARLAGVVESRSHRGHDGGVEVVGAQQNEGVGPASSSTTFFK